MFFTTLVTCIRYDATKKRRACRAVGAAHYLSNEPCDERSIEAVLRI